MKKSEKNTGTISVARTNAVNTAIDRYNEELKNCTKSAEKAKSLALIIQQTIGQQTEQPTNNVTIDYIYGSEDTALFDTLSPVLIGFFVFFFVFLIAGFALTI